MTLDEFLMHLFAAAEHTSKDSPRASWRRDHPYTEACRDRECEIESCARREAIIAYSLAYEAATGIRVPW